MNMQRHRVLAWRLAWGTFAVTVAAGACSPGQSMGPTATATAAGTASASVIASPSGSIAAPTIAPGGYVTVGSLAETHPGGVVQALDDGRVLVAGGEPYSPGPVLGSVEFYDPVLRRFSAGAPMAIPTSLAVWAKLRDGKVLVVGGHGDPAGAQLFDPASSAFVVTGSPLWQIDEQWATVASLRDGNALVIGGPSGGRRAQLFDASSGTFRETGSLVARRDLFFTTTTLADGRVLVAGGMVRYEEYGDTLRTAEIYDPVTGKFSATGSMGTPRRGHAAVLLLDGRVLIIGGSDDHGELATAEVFDPADGLFHPVSPGIMERAAGALALPDGQVLIVGGGGEMVLFDPTANKARFLDPVTDNPGLMGPVLVPGGQVLFPGTPSILLQP